MTDRPCVRGVVVAFDAREGLGELRVDGQDYRFHATQLTDGTRHVAVGTSVTAHLVAWHQGRLEATDVSAR